MPFDQDKLNEIILEAQKLHQLIRALAGQDAMVSWSVMEDGAEKIASATCYTVGCDGKRFTNLKERIKQSIESIPLVQDPVKKSRQDGTLKNIPLEEI